jgi:PAS domain-containing protein
MKYPLLDALGEPYAVGAMATDITEWKNLQILHERDRVVSEQLAVVAKLAEARDVYEAAARNLTDGLMILDRDNRVTFWNARQQLLVGNAIKFTEQGKSVC